jgi:hypothetical protein
MVLAIWIVAVVAVMATVLLEDNVVTVAERVMSLVLGAAVRERSIAKF